MSSAKHILQTIFGYPGFRGEQEAIISHVAGGGDDRGILKQACLNEVRLRETESRVFGTKPAVVEQRDRDGAVLIDGLGQESGDALVNFFLRFISERPRGFGARSHGGGLSNRIERFIERDRPASSEGRR